MNRLPARDFKPAEPGDPEQEFWAQARDAAKNSANAHKTYAALQRAYRGVRPGADQAEHEAAMKRLAAMCGI